MPVPYNSYQMTKLKELTKKWKHLVWCILMICGLRCKYVCFWKVAQPAHCIVKFALTVDES